MVVPEMTRKPNAQKLERDFCRDVFYLCLLFIYSLQTNLLIYERFNIVLAVLCSHVMS